MANIPICAFCKHFLELEQEFTKCRAFPDFPGIPWKIFSGESDHDKPVKGQAGKYIFEREEVAQLKNSPY